MSEITMNDEGDLFGWQCPTCGYLWEWREETGEGLIFEKDLVRLLTAVLKHGERQHKEPSYEVLENKDAQS